MDAEQLSKLLNDLSSGEIHGRAETVRKNGLAQELLHPIMGYLQSRIDKFLSGVNLLLGIQAVTVFPLPGNPHKFVIAFGDDTGILVSFKAASKQAIIESAGR